MSYLHPFQFESIRTDSMMYQILHLALDSAERVQTIDLQSPADPVATRGLEAPFYEDKTAGPNRR